MSFKQPPVCGRLPFVSAHFSEYLNYATSAMQFSVAIALALCARGMFRTGRAVRSQNAEHLRNLEQIHREGHAAIAELQRQHNAAMNALFVAWTQDQDTRLQRLESAVFGPRPTQPARLN